MRLKKYFAILSIVAICSTALVGCSSATSDVSETIAETSELSAVTQAIEYNDNIEGETNENEHSDLTEYFMGTVGYQVPNDWKTDKSDGSHYYHYNIFNELFFVGCTKLESDEIELDDTLIDELIKSDKDTYDNYKEQSKDIINICGCKTLHRTFKCKDDGDDRFCNSYIFITNGYLYLMCFNSDGEKQSPNFDRYEKQIIDSIVIENYPE